MIQQFTQESNYEDTHMSISLFKSMDWGNDRKKPEHINFNSGKKKLVINM